MNANSAQFAASNDLDLVHASKKGDVAAFEELVKRYDRRLLRISQTVTSNREDSEDAVQEALLKAFQNLGEFREDSTILNLADSHHCEPVAYETAKTAHSKRGFLG